MNTVILTVQTRHFAAAVDFRNGDSCPLTNALKETFGAGANTRAYAFDGAFINGDYFKISCGWPDGSYGSVVTEMNANIAKAKTGETIEDFPVTLVVAKSPFLIWQSH